jgi:hypothetical protein
MTVAGFFVWCGWQESNFQTEKTNVLFKSMTYKSGATT